ncbi:leupaxin isoform X2 [Thalassophryne amazonica]|uniref:leupaxin isoform X2 n=1 Tax=Thalassophryne amazonica TaxID=390379 RepID=UPI0014714DEC|nr:leupaxin isoform X2 [Thalassophryne amazonica]
MDELDLLLEELALKSATAKNLDENKSNEASYGELPPPVYAGYDKQSKGSGCSNTYSDLPAPVAASMNPASVTNELDIIMQDLLGQQDVGPSPTPLPLTQKESVKRKKEGGQQQKTESSSTAGSCVKASKKTDAIDDMLGGLSSDLEKIGVRTVAKGHCASCNKCIVGKMITALGEVWHSEHFVCAVCKTELATARFFEREGQPYCDKDYHQLFSPRCAYCKGPILQCSGCGESVMEKYLTAANGTWHPECFVCADCLKPFTDGCFMELDGRPLCSLHFHSRQGTLCAGCGEPITSRCISALNRKFHPEHFVCAFCLRQLSQGIFTEQKGKPYCSACYNKLFV